MKKIIFLLTCLLVSSTLLSKQEELQISCADSTDIQTKSMNVSIPRPQKLKVSGYIQTQFQHGLENASLNVGTKNNDPEKNFNRIGIRRGRIKFAYDEGIASGVFQFDITDKGVDVKDAYLNIKDTWTGENSLRAGVFDRPFGYEISYSSSNRESPERTLLFQTLFPNERDLGAMIILEPSNVPNWNYVKLQAGLFAGNGIKQETDNRKDFIGHLLASKTISSALTIGMGVSYYLGNVYQGTENVYKMHNHSFVLNKESTNQGRYARREYFGFDMQLEAANLVGRTQVRGEYLFGTQPGTHLSSKSPNTSTPVASDTYIRNFNGGYVMLIQDLGNLPLSAVIKYDWYDPNAKIAANDIGLNQTGKADIAYSTLGLGFVWQVVNSVRVQAYYDIVNNEKSENLSGYEKDIKDNVFTLRLQYKF